MFVDMVTSAEPEGLRRHLDDGHGAVHAERAQWALAGRLGRRRAAELVAGALRSDDFVPALLAELADEPEAAERIRVVTDPERPPGLAEAMIDGAVAAARGER